MPPLPSLNRLSEQKATVLIKLRIGIRTLAEVSGPPSLYRRSWQKGEGTSKNKRSIYFKARKSRYPHAKFLKSKEAFHKRVSIFPKRPTRLSRKTPHTPSFYNPTRLTMAEC